MLLGFTWQWASLSRQKKRTCSQGAVCQTPSSLVTVSIMLLPLHTHKSHTHFPETNPSGVGDRCQCWSRQRAPRRRDTNGMHTRFNYLCALLNRYKHMCGFTRTYIDIYMHTHLHTCMHANIHTHIHTYIHVYVYIYVDIYTHTYTYIYIYVHLCIGLPWAMCPARSAGSQHQVCREYCQLLLGIGQCRVPLNLKAYTYVKSLELIIFI